MMFNNIKNLSRIVPYYHFRTKFFFYCYFNNKKKLILQKLIYHEFITHRAHRNSC